jgi:acyl carrier protein
LSDHDLNESIVRDFIHDFIRELSRRRGMVIEDGSRVVEDLGLDSLSLVELVVQIEERFGIEIVEREYQARATFGTVGAVRRLVEAKLREASDFDLGDGGGNGTLGRGSAS